MSFTHGEEKRGGVFAADMASSSEAETNSSMSSKFDRPTEPCIRSASGTESSGMRLSRASRCNVEDPFQRDETPEVGKGQVSWFCSCLNNSSLLCGDRLLEALSSVPAVKNDIGTVPSTSAGQELLIKLTEIKPTAYLGDFFWDQHFELIWLTKRDVMQIGTVWIMLHVNDHSLLCNEWSVKIRLIKWTKKKHTNDFHMDSMPQSCGTCRTISFWSSTFEWVAFLLIQRMRVQNRNMDGMGNCCR